MGLAPNTIPFMEEGCGGGPGKGRVLRSTGCLGGSTGGPCPCSRAFLCPSRCWRSSYWRHGLLLLCGVALLSVLVPGAPLASWLASEDAEHHRLLAENELRLRGSQRFLDAYRETKRAECSPSTRDDDSSQAAAADVGITVLTMARGRRMKDGGGVKARTRYLTQTVATLLRLMNDSGSSSSLRRSYTLRVCNIDDQPELFEEALTLEDVLPVFKKYGADNNNNNNNNNSDTAAVPGKNKLSVWEKLKADYVYCMERTLALGVSYVLLIEDDAVAHGDLFHVLEHVLEKVVEAPAARPVAYVKLYHPRRLLGYLSVEAKRLVELLALSVTLGLLLARWRGVSSCGGGAHPPVSWGRLVLRARWVGWSLVVASLALAVGRPNLLELRRLSPQLYQVTPAPSCCTPAVLYTRQGARGFSAFLSNVTCTARRSTDIRMDEFRRREGEEGGGRGLLV